MDENLEKKPKRPRIGDAKPAIEDNESTRYDKVDFSHEAQGDQATSQTDYQGGYQQRPYAPRQQRPYNQGGYQGGYQQRGGYNQRPYNNRYNQAPQQDANAQEGGAPQQHGGYQQRPYGQQQQRGGYQQRPYGQQQQRGGYQQRPYGQQQQRGGYQQRPYGQQQQRGGYQQRPYGQQQQRGGYQQRPYGQQQRPYGQQQQRPYGQQQQRPYGQQQQRPYGPKQQHPGKRQQQAPRPLMRFTPRPQPVEYEEPAIDPNCEIRLNKFMANAGLCSRREADELIQKGVIKVNGEPVTELGVKITPKDIVEYNDKVVSAEKKCYILLNKPKDCVTTSEDPNGRKTVMDLVKGACQERIYPVGRLDRNTTGVLLLTNDGDLASKLTHPKYVKKKIYQVWTDKPISEEDMQHIADGVELEDGPIHADAVSYVSPTDRKQAGIEIHSGRNRVVRRIFEALGYHVVKLDRVYFAGLTKKNLTRGRWRYLTQEEVNFLKQGSFE